MTKVEHHTSSRSQVIASAHSKTRLTPFRLGATDLAEGLGNWRVSHLMGLNEIRRRYARSSIGQFWVTISTAIMVAALGMVWSTLWRVSLGELLPFISISLILWGLISGAIADATTAFAQSAPMYLNQGMSFSTAIYALVYRNLLIFAHNAPIIVVVMILFSIKPGFASLLALPGIVILLTALVWLSYVIAIACVRFRDLVQVVQSGLLLAFFITPVMWKPDQIPPDKHYLLSLNPFASLLSVVREPLLGQIPNLQVWLIAIAFAVGGFALALPLIGFCKRRIIYWI
jgi:ABC-type polysaccharide/polyol phosphate export permease